MIYVLAGTLLLLVVVNIWLLIQQHENTTAMMILIPLLIFSAGFSWHTVKSIQGYPVASTPNGMLIYGFADRPNIYLLVQDEQSPRFHVVPWSEEKQKQLKEALKQMENGDTVGVDREKGGTLRFYNFGTEQQSLEPKNTTPREQLIE